MSCNSCENCCAITQECFNTYSHTQGVELDCIKSSVEAANEAIESCIGEDCFEDICSGESEIKDWRCFKKLYALLIEQDWLCNYGTGQATQNGVVTANGNGFLDDGGYTVKEPKDIKYRVSKLEKRIQTLTKKFVEKIKEETNCIECVKPKCRQCSCNPCSCPPPSFEDDMIPI